MKDRKKYCFNPIESASFKQAQLASTLASNVSRVDLDISVEKCGSLFALEVLGVCFIFPLAFA